jgi:hypothetical protein
LATWKSVQSGNQLEPIRTYFVLNVVSMLHIRVGFLSPRLHPILAVFLRHPLLPASRCLAFISDGTTHPSKVRGRRAHKIKAFVMAGGEQPMSVSLPPQLALVSLTSRAEQEMEAKSAMVRHGVEQLEKRINVVENKFVQITSMF